MKHVAEKVETTGNKNILLTERGTSFGYSLVSDMTSIPVMQNVGYPVIFDATHSAQLPGDQNVTGGQRNMIPTLAKAAVAAGCNGIFMEVHNDPSNAKSDASTQWPHCAAYCGLLWPGRGNVHFVTLARMLLKCVTGTHVSESVVSCKPSF